MKPEIHPVDEVLPAHQLFLFGLQHRALLVSGGIAHHGGVSSSARQLNFSTELTVNLISATFLLCGIGTLLQSFGPWKIARLHTFIMVLGGALHRDLPGHRPADQSRRP